ncbi:hypothetical protein [Piscinibacter sp.]|uniref:hypothetical protein n=1 Tax=Piscinibacter sp. TaxID=1903157 RepID=UPI003559D7D8
MNERTIGVPIRLARSLPERVLVDVVDALRRQLRGLLAAGRAHSERRRLQREFDAVSDMNETLLKDIGAPEWLITQAAQRREAQRQQLLELHQWGRLAE